MRKANKKVHKESKSLNKVVEDINDYQSSNKRYNYITIYMEKKTNSKKVEVKKKEEKKPLIEKESIEREPRWGGPYIINTNPQGAKDKFSLLPNGRSEINIPHHGWGMFRKFF